MVQRATLVRVHLHIVYEIRSRLPSFWGLEAAESAVLEGLEDIFKEVQHKHAIPEGDMPPI
ncbi:unnamed protein product, partial [Discosporangium mesarthrocarpum]